MSLQISILAAIVCLAGGALCMGSRKLRNTGRGMLVFGVIMALYSVLTIIIMQRG